MIRIIIFLTGLVLVAPVCSASESSPTNGKKWEYEVNAEVAVSALECSAIYYIETAGTGDDVDENKRLTMGGLLFLDIYSAAKQEAVRQSLGESQVPNREELIRDRDWRLVRILGDYYQRDWSINVRGVASFVHSDEEMILHIRPLAEVAINCDHWLEVIRHQHYSAVIGVNEETPERLKQFLLSVPLRPKSDYEGYIGKRAVRLFESLENWEFGGLMTPTFANKQLREQEGDSWGQKLRPPPGSNVIDCFGLQRSDELQCWLRHIVRIEIEPHYPVAEKLIEPLKDRLIIAATHFVSKNFEFESVRAETAAWDVKQAVRKQAIGHANQRLLMKKYGQVNCDFRLASETGYEEDYPLALFSVCKIRPFSWISAPFSYGAIKTFPEDLIITSRKTLYSDIEAYLSKTLQEYALYWRGYRLFEREFNSGQYLAGYYYWYRLLDEFEDKQVEKLTGRVNDIDAEEERRGKRRCRRLKERIRDTKMLDELLERYKCG